MLEQSILKNLEEICGKDHVTTATADLICYSYDATQRQYRPDVVVHPGSNEEISAIMKLANSARVPVFPRGAGSGFTGGSLPVSGGIVLGLSRLDKILEIDEENLIATVEPGVVTEQFQQAVEKVGLFYPPRPGLSQGFNPGPVTLLNAPAVRVVSNMVSPRITSSAWRSSPRPVILSRPAVRP